jgi:acyl transferase domain-containing protein
VNKYAYTGDQANIYLKGTPVGDPIECESIRQTFGGPHRQNELFLGSVKDNIGHAEAASGTAALIKTVLMMQKRVIPKQANFTRLNPKIAPLEPDHMAIPQHTQQWNASKRIAVVNNYGAAGSNAAIVVQDINLGKNETPVENGSSSSITDVEFPFFISAKTSESLQEYAIALKKSLSKIEQSHGVMAIVNLAYNLSVKQNREFEYNYTFMASTLGEVTSKLEQVARTNLQKRSIVQRPVVLCIGGQNGRTIHLDENLFRKSSILQRHLVSYKCGYP